MEIEEEEMEIEEMSNTNELFLGVKDEIKVNF